MKISDGKYLSMTDVFKSFTNRGAQQIAQEISDGAILGETNRQIADRLERLSGLHKNQAMTIARTATNNVATVARNQVMQENEDVLDGYEWVAALDNRTTILCGSLDGQVFSFSDPDAPKPPAHFNCRSTIVPKVKPEFTLGADIEGERPAIGADGKQQIDAGTNYETWLRRQPAAFQDEVLGKDRGKLFRGKKLSLDRFIDAKGNPIPLDQLKALDESFNIKAKTTSVVDTILQDEKPRELELTIPNKRTDAITPEFISEVDNLGRIYENKKTAKYTRIANYDQQPTVVSETDFDAIKSDTLFRGVTDYDDATGKELVNQYFDDEHFVGGGVFGSGTYTSYGPNQNRPKATGFDVASDYAYSNGAGVVFRMKLKPNAKIYNYRSDKPYDLVDEALSKLGFEPLSDLEQKLIKAKNLGEIASVNTIKQRIRLIEDLEASLSADTSRAAIIAGYDAVNIVENKYMVVLNRGAVVTDRKIWELD
jgi:SPP1 gp7 family putative phage head morphogenesis protein